MRRCIWLASLIVLAVAAATVMAQSQAPGRWGQVWGTWVWTTNNRLPALVTFHMGGTVSVSDGSMFGGVLPNSAIRMTPLHGIWEKTGMQSIAGSSLWLTFDATTGVLMGWGRARTSIQFAEDFNSFQGKMFVETLACTAGTPVSCPDPQNPAAKWTSQPNMPPDGFDIAGVRFERVPAGPLP